MINWLHYSVICGSLGFSQEFNFILFFLIQMCLFVSSLYFLNTVNMFIIVSLKSMSRVSPNVFVLVAFITELVIFRENFFLFVFIVRVSVVEFRHLELSCWLCLIWDFSAPSHRLYLKWWVGGLLEHFR